MDLVKSIGNRLGGIFPGMRVCDTFTLFAACVSDVGKRRKNNEDNFYFNGEFMPADNAGTPSPLVSEVDLEGDCCFAVMDGMGGGDYGELASNTASEAMKMFFDDPGNINPCDITPTLTTLCRDMNRRVFDAGQRLGAYQMGSTVVALYFREGQAWICNLGDSRGYRLRNGTLEQLSVDHTDEEEMKLNNITGRKPYLTQFLGIDPSELTIVPHVRSYRLERGDRFLLCSDGLTDMVSPQAFGTLLSRENDPVACSKRLVNAALEAGGRDNITVTVIHVN